MSNNTDSNLGFIFSLLCICSGVGFLISESYVAGIFSILLGLAGIFGKEGR
jgi:hypothetical protein